MLLDPAHAGLELADEDAVADDRSMVFVTARRSPTICSPSSLRVDRKSEATSGAQGEHVGFDVGDFGT